MPPDGGGEDLHQELKTELERVEGLFERVDEEEEHPPSKLDHVANRLWKIGNILNTKFRHIDDPDLAEEEKHRLMYELERTEKMIECLREDDSQLEDAHYMLRDLVSRIVSNNRDIAVYAFLSPAQRWGMESWHGVDDDRGFCTVELGTEADLTRFPFRALLAHEVSHMEDKVDQLYPEKPEEDLSRTRRAEGRADQVATAVLGPAFSLAIAEISGFVNSPSQPDPKHPSFVARAILIQNIAGRLWQNGGAAAIDTSLEGLLTLEEELGEPDRRIIDKMERQADEIRASIEPYKDPELPPDTQEEPREPIALDVYRAMEHSQ